MDDNAKLLETLFEKATDYGKTSLELIKLKTLDKSADVVSSIIPHTTVILLVLSFMLFLNLGLAYWLGEILGRIEYGFFAVAAFYAILGLLFYFLFFKRIKTALWNYIIRQVLK